ncbi:MAG: Crp/Fnr family transcriptional regulator [Spirochaetales bacterium]|nr:Crp/Fnr family transcriptional regulator [Spirochaetales bacterium]
MARIQSCLLFCKADPADLARDLDSTPYRITVHDPGEMLLLRGDRFDELMVILEGRLRAVIDDPDGHIMTVETLHACEAVATSILFAPRPFLPVSLCAETRAELFHLSRQTFLELCRRHPTVLQSLLSDMGARTCFLANRLRFSTFTTIRQKLAIYLLERSRQEGNRRELPVSKQRLAELFGVSRPSLSRVFGQLVAEGVVRLSGREVHILDVRRLQEIAETAGEE